MSQTFLYMQELSTLADKITAEAVALQKEQSLVDNKISNLYHRLELMNLNAVALAKTSVELRDALRQRRKLKDALRYHQSVSDRLKNLPASLKEIDKAIQKDHERWRKETT